MLFFNLWKTIVQKERHQLIAGTDEINNGFKTLFNSNNDVTCDECAKDFDLDIDQYLTKKAELY